MSRWVVLSLAAFVSACIAARALSRENPEVALRTLPLHWGVGGSHAAAVDLTGLPIRRDTVFFYEHLLGKYPRFWNGRPENGGTPHRADLAGHIEKVRQDVKRAIPDPGWNGFAVIDFESWHPIWELCPSQFQRLAAEQVRSENSWLDAAGAARLAKARHESAARTFVLQTIELCKSVRPAARWGFFNSPADGQQAFVEKAPWLWEAQTAFFPVVSVDKQGIEQGVPKPGQADVALYRAHARRAVEVAKRVAGDKPVIAIGWLRYPEFNEAFALQFLEEFDLIELLREPRSAGADGLIFWDNVSEPSLATQYQNYLRITLRPLLDRARER